MTRDQWRAAWRIVNQARELPTAERQPFIQSESSDPEIVLHVMEMLNAPLAEDLLVGAPPDRSGMRIGRYQVGGLLGCGGMGEVYAARDTELDRPVALKFLAAGMGDRSAVKQFIREAKAASALNHPNIVTVHEVIQSPSGLAIAMELVKGNPISIFRGKPLPLAQVVEIGRQVASALATAHEQGIVHRDIKPENLMLRPDGFVKVLDFGLAHDFAGQLAATLQPSGAGLPAGTLRYMSPEQLREQTVAGASDVFSLGMVLYELAAGRHPFESEYAWETAYAIHTREPASPSTVNRELPRWLDDLILSMLHRQSRLRPSAGQVENALATSGPIMRVRGQASWFRSQRFAVRARWAAIVLLAVVSLVYLLRLRPNAPAEANLKFNVLTAFGGSKRYPLISPDSRSITFSWRAPNQETHHVYVKPVSNGEPVQLTFGSAEDEFPAWSPDGSQIGFCRRAVSVDERAPVPSGVYIIPAFGGAARRIADNCQGLSWSPDGKTLAVSRIPNRVPDSGGLDLLYLESGERRRLTKSREDLFPVYSPNGESVAFIRVLSGRGRGRDLFVVPTRGGRPRQLTFDAAYAQGATWTADSREIVFASPRDPAQGSLWRIPVAGGPPRPLSAGLRNADYPSISPRGGRMAFVVSWTDTNIHLRTGPGFPRAGTPWQWDVPRGVALSTGMDHSPSFSPDGERFAFTSDRNTESGKPGGNNEIWISRHDGSGARQLTTFPTQIAGSPCWSPDGAWIAFDVWASNESNIYIVRSAGGEPRRVSTEPGESWSPFWSADGAWIYFNSRRSGAMEIWKMPAGGGVAIQITHTGAFEGRASPDGKTIYFRKSTGVGCCAIWSVPVDGGPEQPVPDLKRFATISRSWGVLKNGIYFIARENVPRQTVRFLSFSTLELTDLVSLEKDPDWSFPGLALSPDGIYLLTVQIDREANDLMMVENFR